MERGRAYRSEGCSCCLIAEIAPYARCTASSALTPFNLSVDLLQGKETPRLAHLPRLGAGLGWDAVEIRPDALDGQRGEDRVLRRGLAVGMGLPA
jgi:hypothetical protein